MKKEGVIYFFALSCCLSINVTLKAQQLGFSNYAVEDGISSNFLYQVTQDQKGFIWTCGESGISRFDGQSFKNFTTEHGLPDNEVLKLYADRSGKIWFVTLKGLFGFIENSKVYPLQELNDKLNVRVTAIREDCNGDILFACHLNELIRIRANKIVAKHKLYPRSPIDFTVSTFSNNLYVDCKKNRVILFTTAYEIISVGNDGSVGSLEGIPDYPIAMRDFDFPDGIMAFSPVVSVKEVPDIGVLVLQKDLSLSVLLTAEQLDNKDRLSMLVDKKKNLWVGTVDGIFLFERIGTSYRLKLRCLKGIKVSSIYQDREGTVWASTVGEGLFLFMSNAIQNYRQEDGLVSNIITSLTIDSAKTLYVGTDIGRVNTISSRGKVANFTPLKPASAGNIYSRIVELKQSGSTLWIARDLGLFGFVGGKEKYYHPIGGVKDFYVGPDRDIWFGTYSGIGKTEFFNPPIPDKEALGIKGRSASIYEDKDGVVWYWLEDGLWSLSKGKSVNHSLKNKILKTRITHIRKDGAGNLWLASQGKGLLCLKDEKITAYTVKEGLSNNTCNSFYLDGDSVIWIATNGGLNKLRFQSGELSRFSVQVISVRQGLASDNVSHVIKDGHNLYVATSKGVSCFDERDVSLNRVPPAIYITKVQIRDKDTTILPNYELSYSNNTIRIEFIGLAYRCLGKLNYQYRMIGLDTNWLSSTYSAATFNSLPPGEYVFQVRCFNEDGLESTQMATVSFTIGRPYWESWWFYATAALLGIGITALIFNGRFRRLEERNKLRQQALEEEQKALRAQMNPHFIFNALNSIQYFIVNNNTLRATEYLAKFAGLIRRILDNSKHSLISIYDELETVRLYVEIEAQRFDSSFDYSIEVAEEVDKYNTEIPPMIIQPYIENAIWHGLLHKASKGKLTIAVSREHTNIVCIIEDDGIGRQKSQEIGERTRVNKHKSVGMDITETRLSNVSEIRKLNYSVHISDLFDERTGMASGTRVQLIFPLIPN